MKRWLIAASLLFCLGFARAGQPRTPVETFTSSFTQQEQILLAGVLADPQNAREFAKDASGPATQAVFDKWRQRIALFSREYLDAPHPVDESARSVKDMVAASEWQMLMTSLRMLSEGGIADQAKFRIFLAMLDNANDDLKADPPDTRNAHKVINLGRSKVSESMKDYLSSPTGRAALAEALRQRQAPEQTTAAAPRPAPKPKLQTKALAQAQAAAEQIRVSAEGSVPGGQAFDGSANLSEGPQAEQAAPTVTLSPAEMPTLTLPAAGGAGAPRLAAPPSPRSDAQDMTELHERSKKVSGPKKWLAALGAGVYRLCRLILP